MPTLYISQNSKSSELKSQMTDSMWQQVLVVYHDAAPLLILNDGTQMGDLVDIIGYLSNQKPTLIKKLSNAKSAAVRTYKQAIKTGEVYASPEAIKARRSTCNSCPFNKTKLFISVCEKCGCNIKSKTSLITEVCPLDKW